MHSPCDLCGGPLRPYRHAWLRRCADCGSLRSDLPVAIPDQAGGSALDEALRETGLEAVRTLNNARLLDALARHAPGGARLLDVGCGPGFLLDAARSRGFDPLGLEPDANVMEAARARGGAAVRHGYFPHALAVDECFGAIVFNDVLEHIPELDAALAASAAHLSDGGILLVSCPDRRGLFFRAAAVLDRLGLGGAYDRLWQRGLPSPHVWYITPAALAGAARRHGLTPAATVRLKTVAVSGLWSRIRFVKDQSLILSLAAMAFAVLTLPVARLLPADASASLFRKA